MKLFGNKKWLLALLCTAVLSACSQTASETGSSPAAAGTAAAEQAAGAPVLEKVKYEADDYVTDWTAEQPTKIDLNGQEAAISGTGAVWKDGVVSITAAGTYVLSGVLSDGQIVVDAPNKERVRLVLNGVELHSGSSAPIYVKQAGKTVITLQEGTVNSVSDGEAYVYEEADADEPNAAIFSKSDLTLNGAGKLVVQGSYNNGITSKDDLKITGGTYEIHAADDGLMGRDLVAVQQGAVTVEAGGDGIKTTNDTDAAKGAIAIEGGEFAIRAGSDGIQSASSLLIDGGSYAIVSGGGSANAAVKSSDEPGNGGPWGGRGSAPGAAGAPGSAGALGEPGVPGAAGRPEAMEASGAAPAPGAAGGAAASRAQEAVKAAPAVEATQPTAEADTASAKGVKAAGSIRINSGTFQIDSADDAIHSNGDITVAGGDMYITSGDDGIHADTSIVFLDGAMEIAKSYEGVESAVVTIDGGELQVTASDDGVNVAGGKDGSSVNGRSGQNEFAAAGDNKLTIRGGRIAVNASGDGLDANGSIEMTGGTVVVNGPSANNNAALDYDGTFLMSGGLLVAAGSAGMAQAPSEDSSQNAILMSFSQMQQAGTTLHLEDSAGTTIATFTPAKGFQSIVISSPSLQKGMTYKLYSGGQSSGSGWNGLYQEGSYTNGKEVVQFELSNAVTWLSETGVTEARSMGPGGGGPGAPGMGAQRGRREDGGAASGSMP